VLLTKPFVQMKKLYLFLAVLAPCLTISAQTISLNELLNLSAISAAKFQQYASKKGFQTEKQQSDFVRMQYTRDTNNVFYLSRQWNGTGGWLQLEKITAADYELLKQKMQEEGFVAGELRTKVRTDIFEKGQLVITASPEIDLVEEKRLYNVVIQNRPLPKAKDLQYAEDLLQLDSHQQLAHVFGADNVLKDDFLTADGGTLPCSVIYPQSPYEAVFIWEDRANFRSLYELRVGGNPHTKRALRYSAAVPQNRWMSRQGVYPTMTLDQLCARNEAPVSFYGWGEEKSGLLSPVTSGKLDFKHLSFVFSCFNCNDEKYYGDVQHSADEAIREYRKVHVATLVLKPVKLGN
jgi:hypothetical protein